MEAKTIDELRGLKAKMERKITEALTEFSQDTGFKVDSVNFRTMMSESSNVPVGYFVETDIKIP